MVTTFSDKNVNYCVSLRENRAKRGPAQAAARARGGGSYAPLALTLHWGENDPVASAFWYLRAGASLLYSNMRRKSKNIAAIFEENCMKFSDDAITLTSSLGTQ